MDKKALEAEIEKEIYSALEFYRLVERKTVEFAAQKISEKEFDAILLAVKFRALKMRKVFDPYESLRGVIIRSLK